MYFFFPKKHLYKYYRQPFLYRYVNITSTILILSERSLYYKNDVVYCCEVSVTWELSLQIKILTKKQMNNTPRKQLMSIKTFLHLWWINLKPTTGFSQETKITVTFFIYIMISYHVFIFIIFLFECKKNIYRWMIYESSRKKFMSNCYLKYYLWIK